MGANLEHQNEERTMVRRDRWVNGLVLNILSHFYR